MITQIVTFLCTYLITDFGALAAKRAFGPVVGQVVKRGLGFAIKGSANGKAYARKEEIVDKLREVMSADEIYERIKDEVSPDVRGVAENAQMDREVAKEESKPEQPKRRTRKRSS